MAERRMPERRPEEAMKLLSESTSHVAPNMDLVTKHMLINGKETDRVAVKAGDTAAVLPITLEGKILLSYGNEQAVGMKAPSIPQARLSDGATRDEASIGGGGALRDIGYRSTDLAAAGSNYASPGYTTETVHTVVARGAKRAVDGGSRVIEVSVAEAIEMIIKGEVQDCNTIQAVLRYAVLNMGLENLPFTADMLRAIGRRPKMEDARQAASSTDEVKAKFGSFLSVVERTTTREDGGVSESGVAKLGDAAVTVPIDRDGRIVFEDHGREILGKSILELPAGKLDKMPDGSIELPVRAGLRELKEETGIEGGSAVLLCSAYSSPRYSTEKLHTVLARVGAQGEDEKEEGEVIGGQVRKTLGEALEMIRAGEIVDQKTAQGVLFYALYKHLEDTVGKQVSVIVSSTSAVKLDAVSKAFSGMSGIEVAGVKAKSGVSEQPVGDETLIGARNRIADAKKLHPGADVYVSIENGIFQEGDRWIDKAVVLVDRDGQERVTYSEGVEFPRAAVDEARRRGFDKATVGQVLKDMGIVKDNADPHFELAGKHRADILQKVVAEALAN